VSEFLSLLIAGIVTGSVYAVTATGLVVTYSTTGIFNFAQGAIGMFLAYLFWQLWQAWHLPTLLSLAICLLVVAPLAGLLLERFVMRSLYRASTAVSLVVTLGLMLLLVGVAQSIWPQTQTYSMPEFFSGDQVTINGIAISYEQLLTVGLTLLVAVGLRVLFTRTRTGIAMRAVVDDPQLAQLSGASAGRVSGIAWILGIVLAAAAGILLAPTTMNVTQLTELVIYGYAAAIVGRLRNLPLTFVGAMVLGIASSLAIGYVPASAVSTVVQLLPMAVLLIVLVVMPEERLQIGRVVKARPPRTPTARQSTGGAVALLVLAVIVAMVLQGPNLATLGEALVVALLALSLVPLAGYAGQVSLCQWTFAGIGAVVMHRVLGGHSLIGLAAAAAVCGVAGGLVALPALRLRGVYLALATVAFAVLMDNTFFTASSIMGTDGNLSVGRPSLFGYHMTSARSFDYFLAVVLALAIVGVGWLRRSAFGRRLVALNDSPPAFSAMGLSATLTKFLIFALSAGLAGVAGALFGGLGTSVNGGQFVFLESAVLFVAITLAGNTLISAAVVAGVGLAVFPVIGSHVPQLSNFNYLLFGLGIVAIGRNPNAMGKVYADVRERWDSLRHRGSGSGPASLLPNATPSVAAAPGARSAGMRASDAGHNGDAIGVG
jgi:branched-chain amino acid transport system permease protein